MSNEKSYAFQMGKRFAAGATQAELVKMAAEAPAEPETKDAPATLKPVSDAIIPTLNKLLRAELTATHQYLVHYQMADNWGYKTLAAAIKARYDDEREHADKLTQRILILGGKPEVSELDPVKIGPTVKEALENDLKSELTAIKDYNDAIRKVTEAGDNVTRKMLEIIAEDEEMHHADEIATMLEQIKQMGLAQFLVPQVK